MLTELVVKGLAVIEEARLELSIFSGSPVKTSLERLLDYVLERNR